MISVLRRLLTSLVAFALILPLYTEATPAASATDTYDYDAFGNLIHSATTLSLPTLNNYLFAGEEYDPDLGLYYNRARYLNVATGRFGSMDTYEGDYESPLSRDDRCQTDFDSADARQTHGPFQYLSFRFRD